MDPIVKVKQGALKGRIVDSVCGGKYYCFQGIPYAKPPIGNLRFKAPEPPLPWEGLRDATKDGDNCYSVLMFQLDVTKGSEDCLYLNVYTNKLPDQTKQLKPVMVWIHGGGFTIGSNEKAMYGPDFLLREDVVVVTLNYRLGALGFTSFEDPSLNIPGNAGLKDMVMALKWVKENIDVFNGDPYNVTIFGESAGGGAVHLLVLSPLAKNLFHRAIAQSGSALNSWCWGQSSGKLFAEALGMTTWNDKSVLEKLQTLSVDELFKIQMKIGDIIATCNKKRPFAAVVENYGGESAFLPEEPRKLIKSGNYNKVPFICGYTSREGLIITSEHIRSLVGEKCELDNFEEVIPHTLNLSEETLQSQDVAKKIKEFYFGDEAPSEENADYKYQLYSDVLFSHGIFETIREHTLTSSHPVYLYRFSMDSRTASLKKVFQTNGMGTSHGDDLLYLFNMEVFPLKFRPHTVEDLTCRRFCKLWTTFARYGDPNVERDDNLVPVEWKPVEKDGINFLEIGENVTAGVNPDSQRMAFWDRLVSNKL